LNITIISLDKWGYNEFIAKEISKRGISVKHIDFYKLKYQYPTFLHKVLNFFTKTLFNYNFKREHLNNILLQQIKKQEKQDITLIIKGDNLSIATIKKIKQNTNHLVTFLNDSMARYPRMKKVYPYFDKVYSFDPDDVVKNGFNFISNYIYFDIEKNTTSDIEHTVFNISSLDKRSKTMPNFAVYFKQKNIDYKLIAFSKDKNQELENLNIECTTNTYSLEETLELVRKSDILLDLQRPNQKGLSFRVLEGIGLNKKIITTNTDVKNYDFYNQNNIVIVDSNNIQIPDSFFKTPYKTLDPETVRKYHISSWVNEVFNLNK